MTSSPSSRDDQHDDASVIVAAADGSALGNPGPAGWAWYIDDDSWQAGGWKHGTNNMGELKAVLDLLESTSEVPQRPLRILCDSQYVINCITTWMPGWKRNGWVKKDRRPVMNRDLLEQLDQALEGRIYEFEWVKGHAGHALNEAADQRARAAAKAYQRGISPESGPGFCQRETGAAPSAASAAAGRDSTHGQEAEGTACSDSDDEHRDSEAPQEVTDPGRRMIPGESADPRELEVLLSEPETYRSSHALDKLLAQDLSWITVRGRLTDRSTALAYPEQAFSVAAVDQWVAERPVGENQHLIISRIRTGHGPVLRSSLWGRTAEGSWLLTHRQDTRAV